MQKQQEPSNRPLIVYLDDNDQERITYSDYKIENGIIRFKTAENTITLPLNRLVKIKEQGGRYD